MALQECDVADKGQQKSAMKDVKSSLAYFNTAWDNLKTVYGKTRFYSYPPNYVMAKFLNTWPDKPDFADQGVDLSFLIGPELQYHKMVGAWLQANGD
jgi:hypothetical protein